MKIIKVIGALAKLCLVAVLLLLLKLIAYILGKLRIGIIIASNKKIYTPVVYLIHPNTQRKIVLMGVIHIADSAYFMELQRMIDTLNGYKVLYEGLGKITSEEQLLFTPDEKRIYKTLKQHMKARGIISSFLKLQGQHDGLSYLDSWVRTDMTLFEFIRTISEKKIDLFRKKLKFTFNFKKGSSEYLLTTWLVNAFFMRIPAILYIYKFISIFSKQKRMRNELIVNERNRIAINGILKEVSDSNVISIWGAAHLPDMIKKLKDVGFEVQEKQWLVAYTMPENSFKDFVDSVRTR